MAAPTGWLLVLFPILAAYPIIYFGLSNTPWMKDATKFGDLSYGTYLCGWPIEQVVRGAIGPISIRMGALFDFIADNGSVRLGLLASRRKARPIFQGVGI
ncbi:hypothetical protein [Bradyrhizobium sp. BWC-3-1]|uniref:hypothetical protein n=1 Tax=Bradyrhizobium sp. BWC-3-1 TaxID=3080012 RepID=UPI00293E72F4|nr:hypothetical protein [Bradyrhizobium sp. BWC-3-1]WOH56024.1 hypothetical protein RX329_27590 [Bradyrhizobium sp. BWC-3-1]